MSNMQEIEILATAYAAARGELADRVGLLQAEIERLKAREMPAIRQAVQAAAGDADRLRAAIETAPELFEKPRTRVFAGVKVGYTKERGKVVIDDEAAVIARIRKLLPKEQADLLIRVREAVHKPAVYDLTAGDLKRLGITVTADTDAVVIRPTDTEVDKLVSALLADAERIEEAA